MNSLMLLIRLLALLAAAAVILWLSLHFSDWMPAAAVGVLVFCFPGILYCFGSEGAGWISLIPFLEGVKIPADGSPKLLWGLIGLGWAAIACTAVLLTGKKWKGSH